MVNEIHIKEQNCIHEVIRILMKRSPCMHMAVITTNVFTFTQIMIGL